MDFAPSPAPLTHAPRSQPAAPLSRATHPAGAASAENENQALSELCQLAGCAAVGLTPTEFAEVLHAVAARCNQPSEAPRETFFRALHLADLALAHACALGREPAWQLFFARFREPLAQAATAITGSATLGRDLAESLPSELFGVSSRDAHPDTRRSPLASYSGRGSLLGWLRATLAQRHIDRHRRTHREAPLDNLDPPAAQAAVAPSAATLQRLQAALAGVLRSIPPEDAFLLSAWFLDGRTLLQIARLLRTSEATVSRRAKRLTSTLRTELLHHLVAGGLSRRAAEEALGTDPRDLTVNLRSLLQSPAASAFQQQAAQPGIDPHPPRP